MSVLSRGAYTRFRLALSSTVFHMTVTGEKRLLLPCAEASVYYLFVSDGKRPPYWARHYFWYMDAGIFIGNNAHQRAMAFVFPEEVTGIMPGKINVNYICRRRAFNIYAATHHHFRRHTHGMAYWWAEGTCLISVKYLHRGLLSSVICSWHILVAIW